MKNDIFITKRGILSRKENTLYFYNKDEKINFPIKSLRQIFLSEDVSLKSGAIKLILSNNIPIHFINKYGEYEASIINKSFDVKGNVLVKQVQSYLLEEKRLDIAKEIVKGIIHNINKVITYYKNRNKNVNIKYIELNDVKNIDVLRSREADAWKNFYNCIPHIIEKSDFEFNKRTFFPPSNEINALISYLNAILYANVLTSIYYSQLHPSISYVHEPSNRTFSLSLDISDIFKPIIVYRIIFKLINKNIIQKIHFETTNNGVYLNEVGRYIAIEEFERKINETFYDNRMKRKISFRSIIEHEINKLYKSIVYDIPYKSFKMWW